MRNEFVYLKEEHKPYIRENSTKLEINTMAKHLNIPASEIMQFIIREGLSMKVKQGEGPRKKKNNWENSLFKE